MHPSIMRELKHWLRQHGESALEVFAAFLIFILLLQPPFTNLIFKTTAEILEKNLSTPVFSTMCALTVILVILSIALYAVIALVYRSILGQRLNALFLFTILLMLAFFVWGTFFIQFTVGKPELSLFLYDSNLNGTRYGNITCKNSLDAITARTLLDCEIQPPLTIQSATIHYTFMNATTLAEDLNDLSFIAPEGVEYLFFDIRGVDTTNVTRYLTVGWPEHFPTLTEERQQKETFIVYMAGLIGAILFSIPIAVHTLRKLYRGRD